MSKNKVAPVTVVVPCYRCADTIERAIASVYSQTWHPAEVILVDDASPDETLKKLYELEAKYPEGWIRVISLSKNDGPGTARNIGWDHATQTYVAFLDADDSWHQQKIEIQAKWMLNNPDAALTGHACSCKHASVDSEYISLDIENVQFELIHGQRLLISNRFPTRSVMLKRDLPHHFVYGKRYIEDFLLWCEICLDGYQCFYTDLPLAYTFKAEYGESGLSRELWNMQKGEMDAYKRLRKANRITSISSLILTLWSLIKYIRRVVLISLRKII